MTERWTPEDTFGARLALVRQRLSWNVTQAANECDLPASSWSTWEDGVKPRDMDEIVRKIAAATGCDPVWLMFGTEPVAEPSKAAS